jgi:hypothetical protein
MIMKKNLGKYWRLYFAQSDGCNKHSMEGIP